MSVFVLVPDEEGVATLGRLDGVRPVRFSWTEPLPPEAAEAEVLVPATPMPGPGGLRELFPNLKLIQLLASGAEPWLDVVPDGVLLSTCRGAHGGSTAEWVVAVLLTIYRELTDFAAHFSARRWDKRPTDTLLGKRVLIVGAGDLANELRRRLEPFDVSVTLVGTTARDGVHPVGDLPHLLPAHDAVVLMVPLTSRTKGMVDARFLAAMPDGAVLVNAARGPVVDTAALLDELTAKRLRAALDVTDPEPLPSDHPLWTVSGLLLTPHIGGVTHGSRSRAYAVAAREIERYLRGERPHNLVRGEY